MTTVQKKRVAGAAVIVMSSIVVSRITGFLREMLVPNMIGVNEVADAYNMAFRVTGLMYDLLVGGAVAAALIPILTGYIAKKDEEDGWRAVGTFINVVMIVMIIFCFMGVAFAPWIVPKIAVGFTNGYQRQLTIELTRILFPSVAFLMLAGLTNGILNSYHRFAAAAYGPSIYNLGCALSILLLSKQGVKTVAYGVMASAFLYFAVQLYFAYKNLHYFKFKLYLKHPGFIKMYKLAIPSLLSSSIVQINIIISGAFASLFKEGSVTALNMADRTWQMPYGVFAQGMGIALLPTLSSKLATGEVEEYKSILMKGVKSVLLLTIPACVGFIVLRQPVIRTIFQFSEMLSEEAVMTASSSLMFFSLALLTQSIVTIVNRAYYANNDTTTPLYIGLSTIAFNILLSKALYELSPLGVGGMALSYSLASGLNALLLLTVLHKKMNGIYLHQLFIFFLKVIPASIIMGIVLYAVNIFFPGPNRGKTIQVLFLFGEITAGSLVYFMIVFLFKVDEASKIIGIAKSKLKIFNKVFTRIKNS